MSENNKSTYTNYKNLYLNNLDGIQSYPNANAKQCETLCNLNSDCSAYGINPDSKNPDCALYKFDACQNGFCVGFNEMSPYGRNFQSIFGEKPKSVYINHDKLTSNQVESLKSITKTSPPVIIQSDPSRHFIEYPNVEITSAFPDDASIRIVVNNSDPFIRKSVNECLRDCLENPTTGCTAITVEPLNKDYYSCQIKSLRFCANGTDCSASVKKNTSTYVRSQVVTNDMDKALKTSGKLFNFSKST
jgi:hypothetical protein